jgi:hypothetical protein
MMRGSLRLLASPICFQLRPEEISPAKYQTTPEPAPTTQMKLTLTAAIFHLAENELLPNERILLRLWCDEFSQLQNHLREWEGMTMWKSPTAAVAGIQEPVCENSQIEALVLQLTRQNLAIVSFNTFPLDRDNEGRNDWVAIMHREFASQVVGWLDENVFNGPIGPFRSGPRPTARTKPSKK